MNLLKKRNNLLLGSEVGNQRGKKEGISELRRHLGSKLLVDRPLFLGKELRRPPEPRHRVVAGGGGGVVRAGVIPGLGGVVTTARAVIAGARSAITCVRSAITSVRRAITSIWSAISTADSSAIRCSASTVTSGHGSKDVVKKRNPEQRLQHWNQRKF